MSDTSAGAHAVVIFAVAPAPFAALPVPDTVDPPLAAGYDREPITPLVQERVVADCNSAVRNPVAE